MFRSLMTIIRELYLYLTKVIFMLEHSVKLHLYIYLLMWQHVRNGKVCFKLVQIVNNMNCVNLLTHSMVPSPT